MISPLCMYECNNEKNCTAYGLFCSLQSVLLVVSGVDKGRGLTDACDHVREY